jgi:c-di-GMP-binding flagellar brake protein YcgR
MRLHELEPPIGKKVVLKVVGLDYKSHSFDAQLIGYQKGESVLLALLSKPGQVLLHKGLKATVEGELDEGRFSFESEIDTVNETPFLYAHLDYPHAVEFKQLRQHVRVSVDTPVEVSAFTGLGMTSGVISGHMLDVSRGGARLVLEKELTSIVTKLEIGVMLSAQDLERDITLTAQVKNQAKTVEQYPECGFAYGVEFTEVAELEALFLRSFCLQEQLRGRVVLLDK